MTKEFNLSEKIFDSTCGSSDYYLLHKEDVKEFIRLLKEDSNYRRCEKIDKLAGKDLI